jgi:hypothetical protein
MTRFQKLISFLLITINTVNHSIVYGQEEKSKCPCLQSRIRFDDSSIEKLVLHPEDVLANPDLFWASDSAYQLVKLWHQEVSLPIPMEQWKGWVQKLKNRSAEEREKNTQLIAVKSMIKKEKEFNDKAIPYICSFLPKDCPTISTTIYFTTAIMASGFQMGNDIVIYGENADKDNLLIHELFHKGQRACQSMSDENVSKDSTLNQFYINLLIEGTATYVGYKALKEFPNVDPLIQNDYRFLQDANTLNRLREKLNEILKKVPSLVGTEAGQKELRDSLWQVGSTDRAFYVVGWYMAKTIDEKLGRDALVETILKGPRSFLRTYNSLVDERLWVLDLYTQK